MKRFYAILIFLGCSFIFSSTSFGADTATITVSVSLQEIISISLTPTSWDIGAISLGQSYESSEFTVSNDGNVAEDINIKATDGAGGWILGTTPGEDTFTLSADVSPYSSYDITISKSDTELISNLALGSSTKFKLKYSSPTSDTKGGGISQNFTIILTATKH